MPRELPDVDLAFCETHDLLRIEPINGDPVMTLGTAEIPYNSELYSGDIMTTTENKASLTSASDTVTVGIQNVDKVIGLTLNTLAESLVGSKAVFMKAFRVESAISHQLPINILTTSNAFTGAVARASGDTTWNAIAVAQKGIRNKGWIEAKLTNNILGASWIGLSSTYGTEFGPANPDRDWTFYASIDRYLTIHFQGTLVKNTGVIWNGGDVIRMELAEDGTLSFIRNGVVLWSTYYSVPEHILLPMAAVYNVVGNIQELRYQHDSDYDAKTLLTGEITDIHVDENTADLTVTSDIAAGQAAAATWGFGEFCPFVFKSTECGYVGAETTCSKRYDTSDGCAGRNNQHRFGGYVDKGELQDIYIIGDGGFPDIIVPNHHNQYNYGNGYYPDYPYVPIN